MIALCKADGLPTPQFRQEGGQFIQILRRPRPAATGQVTGQVPPPGSGQLTVQVAGQVTAQVAAAVLSYCQEPRTAKEIQLLIGLRHRETFLANYLNPLLKKAWLKRTVPGRPTSRLQRYRTTGQGMKWLLASAASAPHSR
jgi:ATP-dependent DNA helicase RecG